jgi:ABC-2 type transport system permease protein
MNVTTSINKLSLILSIFSRLTGPIFEKEVRVSSRRKRYYFLRFTYVVLLMAFVTFAWFVTVKIRGSASQVYQASRMSEAGKYITETIIWFQFITIQFLAAVMLSTSISDEIYHRTLGLLMTTPISSVQIVIGKLLSRLLQLILLLAISLPLLSVIRVFGGVPWNYVLSSLCITFTTAIFTGAISFLFSIYTRQAHLVIVRTLSVCFLFYIFPLLILQFLRYIFKAVIIPDSVLYYINPFIAMGSETNLMLRPSFVAFSQSWQLHCAIMLGLSIFLLMISILCVRKVARCQATSQAGIFATRKERRLADGKHKSRVASIAETITIRPVQGPPIIWREIISSFYKSARIMTILKVVILLLILVFAYGYCTFTDSWDHKQLQLAFILPYFGLALLRTTTSGATCITAEKEARTWPILMTTPLEGKYIALGKIIASCLQAWPFWLLLGAHMILFTIIGCIPFAAFVPLTLLFISSALLVSAVGVFFSSIFKRSSSSAAINLFLFLCFTVPVCCPLPIFIASPLFIVVMILGNTGGWDLATPFHIASTSSNSWLWKFALSQLVFLVPVVIYLSLAFAAFAISAGNVRRRIFN